MGKSRLLRFLLRPDVRAHYLGDDSPATWPVLVDGNRLAAVSEWGLYELSSTALLEAASGQLEAEVVDWLGGLRREVILSENALLARRYVELATQVLCAGMLSGSVWSATNLMNATGTCPPAGCTTCAFCGMLTGTAFAICCCCVTIRPACCARQTTMKDFMNCFPGRFWG
jgi:hypothetical protein